MASWLPRGRTLPAADLRVRHRWVLYLLVLHAIGIAAYATLRGFPLYEIVIAAAVPALGAFAASRTSLSWHIRTSIAATSLMLTSAVIVHLADGATEAHFHFFVMIPIVALYEDWVPFGLAAGIVLLHHGVLGTLVPGAVFDRPTSVDHPWRWAFIHTAFFSAAAAGAVINWRLHEKARLAEQSLTAAMRHVAHHDELTGLPNRVYLLEQAGVLLSQAAETGQTTAVLLLDLDRFKEINDVLGHAAGDALLASVAGLMGGGLREGDLLTRLGGDEFAIVLPDADEEEASEIATRLRALACQTVDINGVALNVDVSVGIAIAPPSGPSEIGLLLARADIAMYSAKKSGGGQDVYRSDRGSSTLERLNLLAELRAGMQRGEVELHYQPQVSLQTGQLTGVEALARWRHPSLGLLSPAEFIPAAECTDVILPLTMQILDMSLEHMNAWRVAGHEFSLAVNLSPRCLVDPDLTSRVLELLQRHDVPPAQLVLEITENMLAQDSMRAVASLTALYRVGVRISIDDFGTGYSSMSYLKRLPVDELKVDRSFVGTMIEDQADAVLVRSIIELGHNFGLTVVAEGVEDLETLEAIRILGCDVVQGFLAGRPEPADVFRGWLDFPETAPWRQLAQQSLLEDPVPGQQPIPDQQSRDETGRAPGRPLWIS